MLWYNLLLYRNWVHVHSLWKMNIGRNLDKEWKWSLIPSSSKIRHNERNFSETTSRNNHSSKKTELTGKIIKRKSPTNHSYERCNSSSEINSGGTVRFRRWRLIHMKMTWTANSSCGTVCLAYRATYIFYKRFIHNVFYFIIIFNCNFRQWTIQKSPPSASVSPARPCSPHLTPSNIHNPE